jgi:hypothetical protein
MTTPGTTPTDDLALGPTYHLLDTGAASKGVVALHLILNSLDVPRTLPRARPNLPRCSAAD